MSVKRRGLILLSILLYFLACGKVQADVRKELEAQGATFLDGLFAKCCRARETLVCEPKAMGSIILELEAHRDQGLKKLKPGSRKSDKAYVKAVRAQAQEYIKAVRQEIPLMVSATKPTDTTTQAQIQIVTPEKPEPVEASATLPPDFDDYLSGPAAVKGVLGAPNNSAKPNENDYDGYYGIFESLYKSVCEYLGGDAHGFSRDGGEDTRGAAPCSDYYDEADQQAILDSIFGRDSVPQDYQSSNANSPSLLKGARDQHHRQEAQVQLSMTVQQDMPVPFDDDLIREITGIYGKIAKTWRGSKGDRSKRLNSLFRKLRRRYQRAQAELQKYGFEEGVANQIYKGKKSPILASIP